MRAPLLAALALLCALALVAPAAASHNCTYPNDCQAVAGRPYCIDGVCRACNPRRFPRVNNCDCAPSEYCVKDTLDSAYGDCRPFESDIIGRFCNEDLNNKGMQTMDGVNDTAFCGLVVYNEDKTPRIVEWSGACVEDRCRACASSFSSFTVVAMCNDGRICRTNEITYAPAGVLSFSYSWTAAVLVAGYIICFGFVAVVAVLILLSVIVQTLHVMLRHRQRKAKMS